MWIIRSGRKKGCTIHGNLFEKLEGLSHMIHTRYTLNPGPFCNIQFTDALILQEIIGFKKSQSFYAKNQPLTPFSFLYYSIASFFLLQKAG
jgi:hypothetical protein